MKLNKTVVCLLATLGMTPAFGETAATDKPANDMQILADKIKADKKFVVAENMQLTESEAKGFWPVYESYQKDLDAINKRTATIIKAYADAWNTESVDNAKAKKLTTDFLAVQADEAKLMKSYEPKLDKVLPAIKTARYLQIEYKIRTIIRYELSAEVPLVPGN